MTSQKSCKNRIEFLYALHLAFPKINISYNHSKIIKNSIIFSGPLIPCPTTPLTLFSYPSPVGNQSVYFLVYLLLFLLYSRGEDLRPSPQAHLNSQLTVSTNLSFILKAESPELILSGSRCTVSSELCLHGGFVNKMSNC